MGEKNVIRFPGRDTAPGAETPESGDASALSDQERLHAVQEAYRLAEILSSDRAGEETEAARSRLRRILRALTLHHRRK